MLCLDVYAHIQDLTDERPLSGVIRKELTDHLAGCESCRQELEITQLTKALLAAHGKHAEIPQSLEKSVKVEIALQAHNITLCRESQEYITGVADSRGLTGEIPEEVSSHIAGCAECLHEVELSRLIKSAIATYAPLMPVPDTTLRAVKSAIASEAMRTDTYERMRSPIPGMRLLRRYPVFAVGLIAAVVLLYVYCSPKSSAENSFNENPTAYISQDMSLFDRLAKGDDFIQFTTTDEEALKSFFHNQGITSAITIPQIHTASLIGGFVRQNGSSHVAHIIYKSGDKTICVGEMSITDAIRENKLAISDSVRHCIVNGMMYWYSDGKHRYSIGMWKNNQTLCSITSSFSPSDLAALFSPIIK